MKISPVAGTPVIQPSSNTGIAPERAQRAKAILEGRKPEEIVTEKVEHEEVAHAGQIQPTATQTIKMHPNKTPELNALQEAVETKAAEEAVAAESQPEVVNSDTVVQAKPEPEAIQPVSPQLAALARQKRALQIKERELADKEKALSNQPSRTELEQRIKAAPLSVLQELGVTYQQLTDEILGKQSQYNPEVEKLKAEVEALKTGVDKKFSASQIAQEESAIHYVADKLDALIANGDDFSLLKEAEGEEEVIRRVYNHWKRTGKELNVVDVAKAYQDELAEEAARYAKNKLVQSRLAPKPEEPVAQQVAQPTRTLTNKDSARPVVDRKKRAIAAFYGQK